MADFTYLESLGIKVGKYLSKGKYGSVYDCTLYNENNLVIKVIPNVVWYTNKGKLLIAEAQKEVILQKTLSKYRISPDILKSGLCKKQKVIFIVMEKIVGKTFFQWYNDCKDEKQKQDMIDRIKNMIQEMNNHHIYHQDMHANNVLINERGKPFITIHNRFGMAVYTQDASDGMVDIDDFEDTLRVEWPDIFGVSGLELKEILQLIDQVNK